MGKSLKGVLPETLVLNERMMYHLNMGYYSVRTRNPHSSVGYFKDEHKFYHPWSHHAQTKMYGFNRIKEIMPLKDFMTLPACVVDEWIEGVVDGESARFELESSKEKDNLSATQKQQNELMKKLGFDKPF